jgi:predicted nucleic acid-binding protein
MAKQKVISMSDFADQVRKIAKQNGKIYFTVDYSFNEFINDPESSNKDEKFRAYIDGFDHIVGNTPQNVIRDLKDHINKKLHKNKTSNVII